MTAWTRDSPSQGHACGIDPSAQTITVLLSWPWIYSTATAAQLLAMHCAVLAQKNCCDDHKGDLVELRANCLQEFNIWLMS